MSRDIRANPRPINRNALALEGGEFPARNLTLTPLKRINRMSLSIQPPPINMLHRSDSR